MTGELSIDRTIHGVSLTVTKPAWTRSRRSGSVDEWAQGSDRRCDALAALWSYGEEHPDTVDIRSNRIGASHGAVASLRASQARALGLPPPPPFAFAADTSGAVGSPRFKLVTRWLDRGSPVLVQRVGAFLETGRGEFLISEPMYSAVLLAERFRAAEVDLADHWTALAEFRRLFVASEGNERLDLSLFLRGLRVYTGAALSLSLRENEDGVDFDPVIFDAEAISEAERDGRVLAEADAALGPDHLLVFQNDQRTGFRAFDDAKRSYLLGHNTYLIVDDDLEAALQVVREQQRRSPAERRAFATNPRAWIAERLAEAKGPTDDSTAEDLEARANGLFWETPEYADRAKGIGLWEEPELPFVPNHPNVWLPERFSVELGGVWIELGSDDVTPLRAALDEAISAGESSFEYKGHSIPATSAVREKLAGIVGLDRPTDRHAEGEDEHTDPDRKDDDDVRPPKTVTLVHENYVLENWSPDLAPRRATVVRAVPQRVRTQLLPMQRDALEWQIDAWESGLPGILNADDQGLGKTIQTLVFLTWLQDHMERAAPNQRLPILVVAPTGLLRVWESEVDAHLEGAKGLKLGRPIKAHGTKLRELHMPDLSGRDTDDGRPRLAFNDMESSIRGGTGHKWWVLTTYETLANYQHSFRQVRFSVVVFDEIQKIKNVKTLASLAARSVRADFRIGLTGTPIENDVVDLWAIMDAVVPGRLGTLEAYVDAYRHVTEARMRELHDVLFKPHRDGELPPVAQRRLKEDVIEHLPTKDYRLYPTDMPDEQAAAYEAARSLLGDGAKGAALKVLHHLRGVSLLPVSPEGVSDGFFGRSARLSAMREVLNRIHERGERVLVFTEDRHMQAFVAQWIRTEYRVEDVPIINGATSAPQRQQRVRRFQQLLGKPGFAAMILSPRAAGVGLTLTAATHVIHLSRWWNPAVEEQCNDRIYRIGQEQDVTVHLPMAIHPAYREQSFDCVLNDLMRRKKSLARAALWPPTLIDDDNGRLLAGIAGTSAVDLHEVDDLDWAAFEDWVLERAKENGDWVASRTPHSGDAGADAVLRQAGGSGAALVQIKHTGDPSRLIDVSAVREILGAASRYEVRNPHLVVVTNARGFTTSARQLALERGVLLIDRDRLGLWPNHVLA